MKKRARRFLKSHFKANPLSYLGWLGVLGILGVMFVPVFIPFLLCFSFFAYYDMVPDELFWENVNRSAAKAFWWAFCFDVTVNLFLFVRGMTVPRENAEMILEGAKVTMGIFHYDQFMIALLAFEISIVLMLLVFTIRMLRLRKQEKKLLEKETPE